MSTLVICMKIFANNRWIAAICRHYLVVLLSLSSYNAFATISDTTAGNIPPIPSYDTLPLPDNQPVMTTTNGELSWLGEQPIEPSPKGLPKGCGAWELVMKHWNPATGATKHEPLNSYLSGHVSTQQPLASRLLALVMRRTSSNPGLSGHVVTQLPLPTGLLALTMSGCQDGKEHLRIIFVPTRGTSLLKLDTNQGFPLSPDLLALSNDTTALVTRDMTTRHITIYKIQHLKSELLLESMPPLAIPFHGDYAVAVAGKNQLMVLGGSDEKYRGCSPCRAETHILDLDTKTWRTGPSMLEARSELGATALPDGSILVTGGWTKAADWGNGPSRTAERWDPATNKFEALLPMPTGNALHKHIWWTAPWGKTLLVVQGVTGAAHSFDPVNRTWRTVGQWEEGSEEGGCGFFPFVIDSNAYAWLLNRSEGYYSSKSCTTGVDQKYGSLSLMLPPNTAMPAPQPPPENMLVTYLVGAAFVPAKGAAPALVIGGERHAGMNNFTASNAVETIDRKGRISTLPSLHIARYNAQAFRVTDGVLVLGGSGPDNPYGGNRTPKPLPAEWLSTDGSAHQWQEVSDANWISDSTANQLKDGSLLVISSFGDIRQLKLTSRDGKLTIENTSWPSLNDWRNDPNERAQIQELDDGRIVVAGGYEPSERIALYSELTLDPEEQDQYVGIGDYVPSYRYKIFDPMTKLWTNSASAETAGGSVVIMTDGRVVKAGANPTAKNNSGQNKPILEISNQEGTVWSNLSVAHSRLQMNDNYRLFTLDGELFASGVIDSTGGGPRPRGLEWLNPTSQQWVLLWQDEKGDNWSKHQGRILVRALTGANGKSKNVIIPIGGL